MDIMNTLTLVWRFLRRYRRIFYLALGILTLVFLLWYLSTFFTTGVDFQGVFLAKSQKQNTIVYSGRDAYGDISISVNHPTANEYDVSFQIPYNTNAKSYKITLGEEVNFWRSVEIIDQQGEILFSGKYQRDNSFLYDSSNLPVEGDISAASAENPYLQFKPNLRRLTGIATGEYEHRLGEWWKCIAGFLCLALILFDCSRQMSKSAILLLWPEDSQPAPALLGLIQLALRLLAGIAAFLFLICAI